jgi:3',5'-cyclic AMP phosphodiesterase CpdA
MRLIAHLSDLHFGRHDPRVVDDVLARLEMAAPDLVAISGDLTQRARRYEFAAARAFLDRLPAPFVVVPGNHDMPLYNVVKRIFRPLSRYGRFISPNRYMLHEDSEIAVLGISTPRALTGANGRISSRQLSDIKAVFEPMQNARWKILVSHHPLLPPPQRADLPAVRGAVRALDAIAAAGVRLVLAGHYHQPFAADSTAQNVTARGSILLIQAGTATSTRLRGAPNSFNMIRIDKDAVLCQPQLWDGLQFAPGRTTRFSLDGSGGWRLENAAPMRRHPDEARP